MPNHHDWERADIYAEENTKLRREQAEFTAMHNALVEHALKQKAEIADLKIENEALRNGSALIVHALDCAIQFTEALFIYLPEGTVLPEAVSTCKYALDQAMHAIKERKA
jgi:hypothetical protein